MRTLAHPAAADIRLDDVLFALSDPHRRAILSLLAHDGDSLSGTCAIAAGAEPSAASHHLKVLREAGVTNTAVAGTARIVSLRREELDARFPGLIDSILNASADPLPTHEQAAELLGIRDEHEARAH
jgi:DNA-binding transcriptional ArsR family regulator